MAKAPVLDEFLGPNKRPSWAWLRWFDQLPILMAYGAFYDTTTQTAGANTATVVAIGQTSISSGVARNGAPSKIAVTTSGVYNFAFSLQLLNTDTATDNVTVWFQVNGATLATSASIIGVPSKHGTTPGATIAAANFFLPLNAGDYVQMVWATDLGTSSIKTYAAGVAPVHPVSPGVILTVNQVG